MAGKDLSLKPGRGVTGSHLVLGDLLGLWLFFFFLVYFPDVKVLISSVYLSEGML